MNTIKSIAGIAVLALVAGMLAGPAAAEEKGLKEKLRDAGEKLRERTRVIEHEDSRSRGTRVEIDANRDRNFFIYGDKTDTYPRGRPREGEPANPFNRAQPRVEGGIGFRFGGSN